ncbi:molybdopterin-dependent oxidoreductase [Halobacteriovorax marinus]|uniref:molybdopterin-dependent oxidoreductase n=1 Tax=Halobacteriovorax marinus TaxID=97084 RepID=UPI003A8CECCF
MKIIFTLLLTLLSLNSFSINYSKQKIKISGKVKKEIVYSIEELSKLPQTTFKINDPYAKNKPIEFEGILLSDLLKLHAKEGTSKIEVIAINDYKVIIDNKFVESEKMLLALKGDGKYLTVREKGPARIVVPGKGKFTEGKLAKEGVNWVWFVKTINYL